jgi:hypothetical protein
MQSTGPYLTLEDNKWNQLTDIRRTLGKSIMLDIVIEGKPFNVIMTKLINKRFIPPNKVVSAEFIKLKGLRSQIEHGGLLKNINFEISTLHVSGTAVLCR